ncbi:MAG: hypothetical protein OSJ64_08730, partial [Firmicutes bacterium]|nr:hypothetical protein [Bacillota bacterium]
AYCYRTDLSPEELEQPNLFFNAPQVKNLLSFGAENQDFLPPLVAALAEIKEMPAYRASLVGYLIGLYAENGLSNPKTDMALAEFYLQNTEQVSEYLWQACRYLGVEPANLAASAGVDEQPDVGIVRNSPDARAGHSGLAWTLSPLFRHDVAAGRQPEFTRFFPPA